MEPVWWRHPYLSVGISGVIRTIPTLSGRDSQLFILYEVSENNHLILVSLLPTLQRTSTSGDMGFRLQEILSLYGPLGMVLTKLGISVKVRFVYLLSYLPAVSLIIQSVRTWVTLPLNPTYESSRTIVQLAQTTLLVYRISLSQRPS